MKQRVVIDIDKELWRQVGIRVAQECGTKYGFVEAALRAKLEKGWNGGCAGEGLHKMRGN